MNEDLQCTVRLVDGPERHTDVQATYDRKLYASKVVVFKGQHYVLEYMTGPLREEGPLLIYKRCPPPLILS